MNKYTLYCTEEQTKKAFELGAPLLLSSDFEHCIQIEEEIAPEHYDIPTAEQMIGWLMNEKGIILTVWRSMPKNWCYKVNGNLKKCNHIKTKDKFISYKEAILAAIDVALDYA